MTAAPAIRTRRRPVFHPLTVTAIDELTEDSVALTFAVDDELRETFSFSPGQHLTLRWADPDDGSEVRRSYSICSTPTELHRHGTVRVGVRQVAGGAFSSYATKR